MATVVYAYLLLAVSLGLTLEHLAGLLGVDWLKTGGDEPNRIFTAVGLTITGVALSMTVLTVRHVRKVRTAAARSFTRPEMSLELVRLLDGNADGRA